MVSLERWAAVDTVNTNPTPGAMQSICHMERCVITRLRIRSMRWPDVRASPPRGSTSAE